MCGGGARNAAADVDPRSLAQAHRAQYRTSIVREPRPITVGATGALAHRSPRTVDDEVPTAQRSVLGLMRRRGRRTRRRRKQLGVRRSFWLGVQDGQVRAARRAWNPSALQPGVPTALPVGKATCG